MHGNIILHASFHSVLDPCLNISEEAGKSRIRDNQYQDAKACPVPFLCLKALSMMLFIRDLSKSCGMEVCRVAK